MTARPRGAEDPEQLRHLLLSALGRASRPLTTAELRDRINAAITTPAHHEEIYRNLLVLENRRQVVRQHSIGRHVAWAPQPPRPALGARTPRRHTLPAAGPSVTETGRRAGTSLTRPTQTGR